MREPVSRRVVVGRWNGHWWYMSLGWVTIVVVGHHALTRTEVTRNASSGPVKHECSRGENTENRELRAKQGCPARTWTIHRNERPIEEPKWRRNFGQMAPSDGRSGARSQEDHK